MKKTVIRRNSFANVAALMVAAAAAELMEVAIVAQLAAGLRKRPRGMRIAMVGLFRKQRVGNLRWAAHLDSISTGKRRYEEFG